MKIFVENLQTNERLSLEVEDSDTIQDVLAKLQARNLTPNLYNLIFRGEHLENSATCHSCGIIKESTLHLVPRRPFTSSQRMQECASAVRASIIDFYAVSRYHMYKAPSFCKVEDILKNGVMSSVEHKGAPDFRWIHLPSNNMSWVERLIDVIYLEQGPERPPDEANSEDESTADKGERKAKAVDEPERDPSSATTGNNDMATQLLLRPHYWARQQFVSRKSQGDVQIRFMKSCFSRISNSPDSLGIQLVTPFQDQRSNSFIFMPFVDWELISMQNQRKEWLKKVAEKSANQPWSPQETEWEKLSIGAKLLHAYSQTDPAIHDRRTLDQAFYYTMNTKDAWDRDEDQVLYRYFKKTGKSEDARILMVDQLWIWVIDTPQEREGESKGRLKTVVTAFPPQWSQGVAKDNAPENNNVPGNEALLAGARRVPDAHGRILNALYSGYNRNIFSVTDLLCLIIERCSALFHPLPEDVNDPLDYLDIFAAEIGEQASQQTKLADSLWEHFEKLQKHLEKKKLLLVQSTRTLLSRNGDRTFVSDVNKDIDMEMRALSDITKETKCLKVVKDIMDELNSISYIFAQQMDVMQSMVDDAEMQQDLNVDDGRGYRRGYHDLVYAESSKKIGVYELPEGHCEDAPEDMQVKYKRLLSTLKKRKKTISHLKDESYRVYQDLCDLLDLKQKQATVFQAMLASQESKEAERQGQTILLFTIVTVIFLPLSFIAAIFSMNAREVNPESNRPISEIFSIMFPLTAAILIISLLLAYSKLLKRFIIFAFGHGVDKKPEDDKSAPADPTPYLAVELSAQPKVENGRPPRKQPGESGKNYFASVFSRRRGSSRMVRHVEEGR